MDRKAVVLSTIALAFMTVVIAISDLSALPSYIRTNQEILVAIVGIYVFLYFLRLLRNFVLFRINSYTTISLFRFLPQGLVAGVIATYGPLKSGELLAMEIYHDAFGIDRGKALSVIVVGRIIDVILVLLLVASGIFIFSRDYLGSITIYLVVMLLVLSIVIILLLSKSLGMFVLKYSQRFFVWKLSHLYSWLQYLADTYYEGVVELNNRYSIMVLLIFSLTRWSFEVVYFYLIFRSFGFSLSLLSVMPVVGLSYAIGVSSGTPGGLGTSQLTAIGVLVYLGISIGLAGLSLLVATAISVLVNGGLAVLGFLTSLFIDADPDLQQ